MNIGTGSYGDEVCWSATDILPMLYVDVKLNSCMQSGINNDTGVMAMCIIRMSQFWWNWEIVMLGTADQNTSSARIAHWKTSSAGRAWISWSIFVLSANMHCFVCLTFVTDDQKHVHHDR